MGLGMRDEGETIRVSCVCGGDVTRWWRERDGSLKIQRVSEEDVAKDNFLQDTAGRLWDNVIRPAPQYLLQWPTLV